MTSLPKRFSQLFLCRSLWFIALAQACLVLFSLVMAWLLRFDFSLPYRTVLFAVAPILISIRLAPMAFFGLLHGWWRYTGVNEIIDILKAVGTGSIAFFILLYVVLDVTSFPRSVYILEPLLTIGALAGARLLSRLIFESVRDDLRSSKRVAIIGAGVAAQMILRELRQPSSGCLPVTCVDDDSSKKNLKVQGVPVMGSVRELPEILRRHPVDEILIAVPSATTEQMDRFLTICETTGTKYRTVPALRELIASNVTIKQLREVNLEDLLARQPVRIDLNAVGFEIEGRTVMVTGAAGSIGSELCRQLIQFKPGALLCVDRDETRIFYLQRQLANYETQTKITYCMTDIADHERMLRVCNRHRPEILFHTAAHKQAPLLEGFPSEAINNNVFALVGLLGAAEASGCQTFVLISTDKAVNAVSVMGATKRIGEMILSCRPTGGMRCISVRFGNVLGSNGSVIPLLQEQIRNGGELTITHPSVCRFFMTICEAVSLVLQASTIGKHGEILVLDMGRPIHIVDLARTLIRLSGKSPEDVRIRFTGLRPGEKLCEELFYPSEKISPTRFPKILSARGRRLSWHILRSQLEDLKSSLEMGDDTALRTKLMAIVSCNYYRPNRLPSHHARPDVSVSMA